jgi:hypothetical protein
VSKFEDRLRSHGVDIAEAAYILATWERACKRIERENGPLAYYDHKAAATATLLRRTAIAEDRDPWAEVEELDVLTRAFEHLAATMEDIATQLRGQLHDDRMEPNR